MTAPAAATTVTINSPGVLTVAGGGLLISDAQNKAVTIMGDKRIPYRLLRKVMVTCARANFSDVSFAVMRKNEL